MSTKDLQTLNMLSDIIVKKQPKVISYKNILSAIEVQMSKCLTLTLNHDPMALYGLVMLQVLLYLRDGGMENAEVATKSFPPAKVEFILEELQGMQPEVDTYAAGLYKGYMAIMPPLEFQIPNDANDELLNLFQNAIDEDVRAQFEIGSEFINEDPPNYYAAHYWMQLASLQGHPQAEICLKTLTKFGDDMFQNDTDIKLRKKKNRKSLSLRSLKLDDINQPESATPSPRSSINTANQSPLANDIQIPKVAHDIKSSSSTGIDSARFSNQPTTFPSMDVKSTDQVKKEMEFAKPTDTKCTPGLSSFSCF